MRQSRVKKAIITKTKGEITARVIIEIEKNLKEHDPTQPLLTKISHDGGGEFCNAEMTAFINNHAITSVTSHPIW